MVNHMKKIIIFTSIGMLITLGIVITSYKSMIEYDLNNSKTRNVNSVKSFITESNEQYHDQVTPQRVYLNNTVDTVEWSNLSNNAYTVVVDDSSNTRENSEPVFVSELLRSGDSAQFKITKSGTYVATFIEEMTSRGWVNLLPSQDIIVNISD